MVILPVGSFSVSWKRTQRGNLVLIINFAPLLLRVIWVVLGRLSVCRWQITYLRLDCLILRPIAFYLHSSLDRAKNAIFPKISRNLAHFWLCLIVVSPNAKFFFSCPNGSKLNFNRKKITDIFWNFEFPMRFSSNFHFCHSSFCLEIVKFGNSWKQPSVAATM